MALNRFLFSCRFFILVLCSVGVGIVGANFSALHFSWTCMVNTTAAAMQSNNYDSNSSSVPVNTYGGDLDWGKDVQQVVFSGYSLGALLFMIVAGASTDKFGAKRLFSISIIIIAAASMLIPAAAIYTRSQWLVFVLRIMVGLGGAAMWSMIYATCSHWVPKAERGIAMALLTSGFPAGQGVGILLSGLECSYLGWPSIFFASGGFTLVFSVSWLLLYSNEPENSKFISKSEMEHILRTRTRVKTEKKTNIPWRSILTSPPIWAACIARGTGIYLSFITMQFMPTYMKEIYLVDPEQNGLYSSLPLGLQLIGRWVAGYISELPFSTASGRIKIISAVTLFGGSMSMVALAINTLYIHSAGLAIVLFCFVNFFSSFQTGGYTKTPLYMAPQFSSLVGSMVAFCGYIGQMSLPFIVAGLTGTVSDSSWSHVFIFAAVTASFGGLCFSIFGSGELQPWADQETSKPIASIFNSKSSTVTLISVSQSTTDLETLRSYKMIE